MAFVKRKKNFGYVYLPNCCFPHLLTLSYNFPEVKMSPAEVSQRKTLSKSSILLLFPQLRHYLTFPFLYPLINPSHFSSLLSIGVERKHYKVTTTLLIWGIQPRVLWPCKIITAICLSIVLEEKQAHAFITKRGTQKP